MTLGVGAERRQVDDGELRHEFGEVGALRADQQLADEQRVPGIFGEHARLDLVLRIGAAIEVLREQRLALHMRLEVGKQRVEIFARHLAVAVPPQGVAREIVDNGVLVFRRAAGVMAGKGAERAARDNRSLAGTERVLVERRFRQIPMDRGQIF